MRELCGGEVLAELFDDGGNHVVDCELLHFLIDAFMQGEDGVLWLDACFLPFFLVMIASLPLPESRSYSCRMCFLWQSPVTMTPSSPSGGIHFDSAVVRALSATFRVVRRDDSEAAEGVGMN